MKSAGSSKKRELILIGGGHAHIQLLKAWSMGAEKNRRFVPIGLSQFATPPPQLPIDVHVTLVSDRLEAIYSGMVPGFIAGQYKASDLSFDLRPLARAAGVSFVRARALRIDSSKQLVELEGRPALHYDAVSVDIGSTVSGLDTPGVREFAFSTRPIASLVQRFENLSGDKNSWVVVGGGAGGIELCFALRARLPQASICLIEKNERILPTASASVRTKVERALSRKNILIKTSHLVMRAERGQVLTTEIESAPVTGSANTNASREQTIPTDGLLWVTGAQATDFFKNSNLATDDRGFACVRKTLQALEHDNIFVAGDGMCLETHPRLHKAGVYAVRSGPVLAKNLVHYFSSMPLKAFRPQRAYLSILNTCDGSAIAHKWGLPLQGPLLWRLKNHIDLKFMSMFQITRKVPVTFRVNDFVNKVHETSCGGCAAKLPEESLSRALSSMHFKNGKDTVLGLENPDDVAAVKTPGGELILSTVDVFKPFTDDPYKVAQIAAVSAASDIFAKGGQVQTALLLVTLPENLPAPVAENTLQRVLKGAQEKLSEMQIELVGGQTNTGAEFSLGFSMNGFLPEKNRLLRKSGLRAGDILILTKPLGTGVLFYADMKGLLAGTDAEAALRSMAQTNRDAAQTAQNFGATACTDVTGFGLAGHLLEMLQATPLGADIALDRLPVLPGALELLEAGWRSTAHEQNRRAVHIGDALPEALYELLFDPQTSGGLLFGVPPDAVPKTLQTLHSQGYTAAAAIGRVTNLESPRIKAFKDLTPGI